MNYSGSKMEAGIHCWNSNEKMAAWAKGVAVRVERRGPVLDVLEVVLEHLGME